METARKKNEKKSEVFLDVINLIEDTLYGGRNILLIASECEACLLGWDINPRTDVWANDGYCIHYNQRWKIIMYTYRRGYYCTGEWAVTTLLLTYQLWANYNAQIFYIIIFWYGIAYILQYLIASVASLFHLKGYSMKEIVYSQDMSQMTDGSSGTLTYREKGGHRMLAAVRAWWE